MLLILLACTAAPSKDDTGSTETGLSDSGDTGTGDTDSGDTDPGDTGSGDTGTGDTDSADTGSGDTGSGDTDSGDTDSADTGTGDTGTGDTGAGDTGDTAPSGRPLDECAATGTALTEVWTTPTGLSSLRRLAWRDGRLVVADTAGRLVAFDAPSDGTPITLAAEEPAAVAWADLYLDDAGRAVLAGESSVGLWDPDAGTLDVDPTGATDLRSVAPAPEGARVTSTTFTAAFTPGDAPTTPLPTSLDEAHVLAGDTTQSWVAGTVGSTIAVGHDPDGSGYGAPTSIPSVFGPPSGLGLLPDGTLIVAGGPDSYGWIAHLAADGTLLAATQYESPGLPRLVTSPGSERGWGLMVGMGVLAAEPDGDFAFLVSERRLTDLVVDPDGAWLLTADEAGAVRRWECAP